MYSRRLERAALAVILAGYLIIGILYAVLTPDWQVPDEPAHYNYVRQLAGGEFPVMEPGDYSQEYLEHVVSSGFPPGESLAGIQYQDYQPPLYYLLATPLYWLSRGSLMVLRLFSLLIGAGVIALTFAIAVRVFPSRPVVILTALVLVAFIPQHIAMMAGVNNDSLSELLVSAGLFGALLILEQGQPVHGGKRRNGTQRRVAPWICGLLLGAVFVTKLQAYVVAPLLAVALLMRWHDSGRDHGWLRRWVVGLAVPALVVGSAWWIRNLALYGGLDLMALARHNSVVVGQPTTAEWIRAHGLGATLERLIQFTFQSFWGQFGWMSVPMPPRVYQGLLLFSAATLAGLIFYAIRRGTRRATRFAELLMLSFGLTAVAFIWYNLGFVQHQGRYLYGGLIALSLAAGVAWEWLVYRGWAVGAVVFGLGLVLGLITRNSSVTILSAGCSTAFMLLPRVPTRRRWLASAMLGAALAGLSVMSLFRFVLPTLG